MKLNDLTEALQTSPEANIRFQLPNGQLAPAHAHVTEVAHISKRFIDCGGTAREESFCRLQTWVADDFDHRLNAGKLAKILAKATPILSHEGADPNNLEVDIEHDIGFVTQFTLEEVRPEGADLVLILKGKNTACLAPELCCPPQANASFAEKLTKISKSSK